ncbi:hypothetical protein [Pantoea sp. 1B4]|uniref:hypothetical protein n=1 Tax=Pantoea sp. 1B4 TaxID=2804760 RepID=UPI002D7F1518|nr:hypothetical protein [Pantoea sp. 1B4]
MARGSHFDAVWEHAKAPKRWVEGVTTLSALSAVASETMEALGLGIGAGAARVTKGGAEKLFTSGKTSAAETALDLANKSGFRVSRESIGNAAALVPNAYSYLQQGVFGLLYQEAERAVANKLHPKPADATEEEAPVSSGARTPEGAPAPSVGTEARTPAGTPAPSVGTEARTPAGTPAPSVGTEARTPEGTPAPSVGTEARTPAGTPAPSTGTRAKGPSEQGESDSDSVHSHNSGPLRNTPPERSSEMRAAGDTSAWWHSFPDLANIKSPQPEKLTQADYEAIIAVLEAEAEKMSERIAEMIPLPDSLPTSSASSVTSGSSASSEAAGPAGSPEPEETKKAS